VVESPASKLADGIRYLRGGSLDRAWGCFEHAAEHTRDPRVRSEAFRRLADVKRRRAEWDDALRLTARALEEASGHGLANEAAAALNIEATIHLQRGEFDRAVEVYEQALGSGPDAHQRGLICQNLGTAFAQNGRHAEAGDWYARSSAAFRLAGRRREELLALVNQGNMRMDQGDLAAAETVFWEALVAVNELFSGDAELNGLIEMNLAEALARQGSRLDLALDLVLAATGHFAASDNRPYRVACHRVVALISERRGEMETAIGALERGGALAREIGSGPEIAYFDRELSRLRRDSGDIPS
jgi:tetratricopeptide (TPR) repeat protein